LKYPDFNVDASGPNGSYVRGKGGGSTPIRTPTPSNQNGNIITLTKRNLQPGDQGRHVLGSKGTK